MTQDRAATAEIVRRGVDATWRSAAWWAVGIVAFNLVNVAFWPSLRDSDTLAALEEESGALLEAFGAGGLTTASGYLDGQVYALLLPLLLAGMAVAAVSALTAGEEDAGRLAVLHTMPVSRPAVWLGRLAAGWVALAAVTTVVLVTMLLFLVVFDLDAGVGRVAAATVACGLLAAFHSAVAYALAGAGLSRGRAIGLTVVVLVLGYLVSTVLPLAEAFDGVERLSPWYWAIRTQPVSQGVPGWGWLTLAVATAVLVTVGTALVRRRDIRSP